VGSLRAKFDRVTRQGCGRNLECADNGGALDFLTFLSVSESKAARATLAAALQIYFPQPGLMLRELY
jgi:hypothetical protein